MTISIRIMTSHVRIGFEDEPASDVLDSLERITCDDTSTLQVLAIGHQRYLDLDIKIKNSTEDPRVWILLKTIEPVSLRRIDLHFQYHITSDKEARRYEKSKQRLQLLVSKLAQALQRKVNEDENQVSVDGNSKRVEEPMITVVSGCASILFTNKSL